MTFPRSIGRPAGAALALATVLALAAGCTDGPATESFRDSDVPSGSFQLVAFSSCDDALGKLKQAARGYVGPWGFGTRGGGPQDAMSAREDAAAVAGAPAAPGAAKAAEPAGESRYSGTNTHEAGVDEPDLVKTDGRRIITISQGVLRVVDAAGRRVTGQLDLRPHAGAVRWPDADLLLRGDRALVLFPGTYQGIVRPATGGFAGDTAKPAMPTEAAGPLFLLVDLTDGSPELVGSYTIDGELVDARQVGETARIVVRSGPRLAFPYDPKQTDAQRLAANEAVIDTAGPDEWLPRYKVSMGDRTSKGRVSCQAVSRPTTYSGTSMVTVLSFDLTAATLGNGDPVTVVADGDTIYSNGPSLYVANDQRWQTQGRPAGGFAPEQRTEFYKFDTSRSGQPRYVAAGSVPGWLINQYAMSERDGHLRVATTVGQAGGRGARSESTVYVLAQQGKRLVETGKVGGLGKGERIYAVRFVGDVGYVVTFRQTDPLYTVDLRNPQAPKVLGELKITGYSAYLHPAGDKRLLGVGQEATAQGRVQGTQVSLFDVADLTAPNRIAQYHVRQSQSEAEFDPHAFLYWPDTGLLVVPIRSYGRGMGSGEALVLRVGDDALTEVGTVTHPASGSDGRLPGDIRRSLVIDDVLWTVSAAGLMASDQATLRTLAWIPFTW